MNRYLSPWTDETMHGKPWWKIHVWPHVVGGAAIYALLLLPWWTIDTLWERLLTVAVFQTGWEVSQVITWARRPWLRKVAWLWEPIDNGDNEGWSFRSFAAVLRNMAYGFFWGWASSWVLVSQAPWWSLLFVLGMQVLGTRLEHENYRGAGEFNWQNALWMNLACGAGGWALWHL